MRRPGCRRRHPQPRPIACRSRSTPSCEVFLQHPPSRAPGEVRSCDMDESASSVHIMDIPARSVPGTQAVARAARLLRLVTSSGEDGAKLQSLARSADLSRSTAHRLLSALRAEGLVDRDEETGRWMPGPELFLMGSVAAARYDVTTLG